MVPWNNIGNRFRIILSFRWCCDADKRLNSIDEIKAHPFFNGVDWQNIRYERTVCLFSLSIPKDPYSCFLSVISLQWEIFMPNPISIAYKQICLYCFFFFFILRERPAAIPIHVKSIDDTSNFDDFPESEFESSKF